MNGGRVGARLLLPTSTNASGVWGAVEASTFRARRYTEAVGVWPVSKDPSFSSVKGLFHFEAIAPATTSVAIDASGFSNGALAGLTDNAGSAGGFSQERSKFGTQSLRLNASLYMQTAINTGYRPGTGDFTLECFIWQSTPTTANLFDLRTGATQVCPLIYTTNLGAIVYHVNGVDRITSANSVIATTAWQHIAVCRESGNTIMYVAGVQVGSTYVDANDYNAGGRLTIGAGFSAAAPSGGWVDEVRVTIGVARYSGASLTVPTDPFPDY